MVSMIANNNNDQDLVSIKLYKCLYANQPQRKLSNNPLEKLNTLDVSILDNVYNALFSINYLVRNEDWLHYNWDKNLYCFFEINNKILLRI